jgi:pyruvate dehydrogenase (quinone)
MPSHISFEQARKFASTTFKGDPNEVGMLTGVMRQVFSGILPGEKE